MQHQSIHGEWLAVGLSVTLQELEERQFHLCCKYRHFPRL